MINSRTKAKYRRQRRDAALIARALRAAVPNDVSAEQFERGQIDAFAKMLAQLSGQARKESALMCSADVCAALGNNTPYKILYA